MIYDIYLTPELQSIFILLIIFTIATFIAFKFNLRNIVVIFLIAILIILLLYFSDLINLEISIFAFLLIPVFIILICKKKDDSDEVD